MYVQGRLHTTQYTFILQTSSIGSILCHLQAFFKGVNTEILKLPQDVDLPFTVRYIINIKKVFLRTCRILLSNNPCYVVCDRSPAEIVGSNPTGGMDVCLL